MSNDTIFCPEAWTKNLNERTVGLSSFYRISESEMMKFLVDLGPSLQQNLQESDHQTIAAHATRLIEKIRAQKLGPLCIETLLQTYNLGSQEGLALMCLAEALLRIPDKDSRTKLIRDKIGQADWTLPGQSNEPFLVKLASMGLATADRLMKWGWERESFFDTLGVITRKLSEPVIRSAMVQTMKILGGHFVMGETIEAAIKRSRAAERQGYRHSYDMLGESAHTAEDAQRYSHAYTHAIQILAHGVDSAVDIFSQPSISVKLSALHPRYDLQNRDRVMTELLSKIQNLAYLAKDAGIGLTIDAEESERLTLSLDIFEKLAEDPYLAGWNGLGLAVQAYQKRAFSVLTYIIELAKRTNRRIPVRLVKGAYWDSEIKRTQERGLSDYPVFTKKIHTDVQYQRCAWKMLSTPECIYPQFATHNAQTVAAIFHFAEKLPCSDYEFQRLHGMGEPLYAALKDEYPSIPCRIYAPVGPHRDLLAYLVRRLLENGANSSFVHQIYDPLVSLSSLVQDPLQEMLDGEPHPKIPLPRQLYAPHRLNSLGLDLWDDVSLRGLSEGFSLNKDIKYAGRSLIATPFIATGETYSIHSPAAPDQEVGTMQEASATDLSAAITLAAEGFASWSLVSVEKRAEIIDQYAHLLEKNQLNLMALLIREAGKTPHDAISEVREAVDFCRYYALQARQAMAPVRLHGPTGELNEWGLHPRGIFACISPWNFPLAIFIGQVVAALVTGNTVLAKPSRQTPLIAYTAVLLAHEAGIPKNVLQLTACPGRLLSEVVLSDGRLSGVAFTGSTAVAQDIQRTLAGRENAPIAVFIAETGGINAMIVDSSALLEQVVNDVIISAFQSAGQRCSALRLLYLQEDIADDFLTMLTGAMQELRVGDPAYLSTDVGPVIDGTALAELQAYVQGLEGLTTKGEARCVATVPLQEAEKSGYFIAPQVWEVPHANMVDREVFGPILHVVRFKRNGLPEVMKNINQTRYGLTLGLHSRINETITFVRAHARVGNFYVNRSMIGAVVGVQPFGGEGLSGTGPKAGGPHYIHRFTVERTFSQDTTAAGGNASLFSMMD